MMHSIYQQSTPSLINYSTAKVLYKNHKNAQMSSNSLHLTIDQDQCKCVFNEEKV